MICFTLVASCTHLQSIHKKVLVAEDEAYQTHRRDTPGIVRPEEHGHLLIYATMLGLYVYAQTRRLAYLCADCWASCREIPLELGPGRLRPPPKSFSPETEISECGGVFSRACFIDRLLDGFPTVSPK